MSEKKMTSSRKHHLKSVMLAIAATRLEQEAADAIAAKETYLSDNCPSLDYPSSIEDLQKLCKELHSKIDIVDEDRYDAESKVTKGAKEVEDLLFKVTELKGMKKPALKKVRLSADQMLQALLGSKHKVSMDLRSNLKQVKKEVKEEAGDAVGDWRKNVEDKAGMGGRMKMFEGAEA
ncbi:troponin I, fast skeletal muscle-like isoform X1 [Clupea harengus]|uniref:Troponin I, fast skeletal muscle n=1 Tax=Clupea harengus TaxID=7950 RepID=Q90365_CLUHA|nr:troponin I, fast skeletal muscle-like [Clupea harengus]XP_012688131.2 troponin I, fast skeletal muscle-like isoform X1 [Clupea harengus]AAB05824.1 Troponin-I [Clupea harengus]